MNSGPRVAILGATSHIAKGLIAQFLRTQSAQLVLFGRSAERIRAFLESAGCAGPAEIMQGYDEFDSGNYDVIINCVGAFKIFFGGIKEPVFLANSRALCMAL